MSFSLKKKLKSLFCKGEKPESFLLKKEDSGELSDYELEIVIGGMTKEKFEEYRVKLIEKYFEEIR